MSDIRKADISLLLTLSVLLEEGSVSRTAIRLNLTQPTVSNMLARLRNLFDDPLFTRTKHGLIPTSRALALEPELRKILSSVEALVAPQTFDPASCDATVTISSNDYMQFVVLAPALIAMSKMAPNLRFAVRQAEIEDLPELMDRGEIDIAVTTPEFSDVRLRDEHLYFEDYVLVSRIGHPMGKSPISIEQFLAFEHAIVSPTAGSFHGPTDDSLDKMGLKRRVVISVSSFFTLTEVVEHSDTLALIPRRLYDKFSDRLVMAEAPIPVKGFEVMAVWHNRNHSDPLRKWVVDQLQAVSQKGRA